MSKLVLVGFSLHSVFGNLSASSSSAIPAATIITTPSFILDERRDVATSSSSSTTSVSSYKPQIDGVFYGYWKPENTDRRSIWDKQYRQMPDVAGQKEHHNKKLIDTVNDIENPDIGLVVHILYSDASDSNLSQTRLDSLIKQRIFPLGAAACTQETLWMMKRIEISCGLHSKKILAPVKDLEKNFHTFLGRNSVRKVVVENVKMKNGEVVEDGISFGMSPENSDDSRGVSDSPESPEVDRLLAADSIESSVEEDEKAVAKKKATKKTKSKKTVGKKKKSTKKKSDQKSKKDKKDADGDESTSAGSSESESSSESIELKGEKGIDSIEKKGKERDWSSAKGKELATAESTTNSSAPQTGSRAGNETTPIEGNSTKNSEKATASLVPPEDAKEDSKKTVDKEAKSTIEIESDSTSFKGTEKGGFFSKIKDAVEKVEKAGEAVVEEVEKDLEIAKEKVVQVTTSEPTKSNHETIHTDLEKELKAKNEKKEEGDEKHDQKNPEKQEIGQDHKTAQGQDEPQSLASTVLASLTGTASTVAANVENAVEKVENVAIAAEKKVEDATIAAEKKVETAAEAIKETVTETVTGKPAESEQATVHTDLENVIREGETVADKKDVEKKTDELEGAIHTELETKLGTVEEKEPVEDSQFENKFDETALEAHHGAIPQFPLIKAVPQGEVSKARDETENGADKKAGGNPTETAAAGDQLHVVKAEIQTGMSKGGSNVLKPGSQPKQDEYDLLDQEEAAAQKTTTTPTATVEPATQETNVEKPAEQVVTGVDQTPTTSSAVEQTPTTGFSADQIATPIATSRPVEPAAMEPTEEIVEKQHVAVLETAIQNLLRENPEMAATVRSDPGKVLALLGTAIFGENKDKANHEASIALADLKRNLQTSQALFGENPNFSETVEGNLITNQQGAGFDVENMHKPPTVEGDVRFDKSWKQHEENAESAADPAHGKRKEVHKGRRRKHHYVEQSGETAMRSPFRDKRLGGGSVEETLSEEDRGKKIRSSPKQKGGYLKNGGAVSEGYLKNSEEDARLGILSSSDQFMGSGKGRHEVIGTSEDQIASKPGAAMNSKPGAQPSFVKMGISDIFPLPKEQENRQEGTVPLPKGASAKGEATNSFTRSPAAGGNRSVKSQQQPEQHIQQEANSDEAVTMELPNAASSEPEKTAFMHYHLRIELYYKDCQERHKRHLAKQFGQEKVQRMLVEEPDLVAEDLQHLYDIRAWQAYDLMKKTRRSGQRPKSKPVMIAVYDSVVDPNHPTVCPVLQRSPDHYSKDDPRELYQDYVGDWDIVHENFQLPDFIDYDRSEQEMYDPHLKIKHHTEHESEQQKGNTHDDHGNPVSFEHSDEHTSVRTEESHWKPIISGVVRPVMIPHGTNVVGVIAGKRFGVAANELAFDESEVEPDDSHGDAAGSVHNTSPAALHHAPEKYLHYTHPPRSGLIGILAIGSTGPEGNPHIYKVGQTLGKRFKVDRAIDMAIRWGSRISNYSAASMMNASFYDEFYKMLEDNDHLLVTAAGNVGETLISTKEEGDLEKERLGRLQNWPCVGALYSPNILCVSAIKEGGLTNQSKWSTDEFMFEQHQMRGKQQNVHREKRHHICAQMPWFANHGSPVELFAPGVKIMSPGSWEDGMAFDEDPILMESYHNESDPQKKQAIMDQINTRKSSTNYSQFWFKYRARNGTSFAAPQVAAAGALLFSILGSKFDGTRKAALEVKRMLIESGRNGEDCLRDPIVSKTGKVLDLLDAVTLAIDAVRGDYSEETGGEFKRKGGDSWEM